MNRVEEIRERLNAKNERPTIEDQLYDEDVGYLLSKLEIAETALRHVRDFLRLEEKWEAAKFSDQALRKIREE